MQNIEGSNAEKSVELAMNNAIERMHTLEGADRWAIITEYKEWLSIPQIQDEVLIIRDRTKE